MSAPKKRVVSRESTRNVEFYEVMQTDLRQPYTRSYSDTTAMNDTETGTPVGKTTAIVTLVSLVVAVAVLTFIVISGIRAALG